MSLKFSNLLLLFLAAVVLPAASLLPHEIPHIDPGIPIMDPKPEPIPKLDPKPEPTSPERREPEDPPDFPFSPPMFPPPNILPSPGPPRTSPPAIPPNLFDRSPVMAQDLDADELLERIGEGRQSPKIPVEISVEAKNFLKGCLAVKPMYRLTAEMLLNHPFLEGLVDDDESEECMEASDVNADSLLLLLSEAEAGDELTCPSCSQDDSFVSEEESVSYWSEEVLNGEHVIGFAKEGTLNIHESLDTSSSRSDSEFNHALSKPVPKSTGQQFPGSFTIPSVV